MDIYEYFLSQDVAEHCKKIGREFTPLEMAAIVAASFNHTPMLKRHRAWRSIIKNYPDMPIIEGAEGGGTGLHSYLRKLIKWEKAAVLMYHEASDEYVYTPLCKPDDSKMESADYAADYPESFYRYINGYTLDSFPTPQLAWEALSKEWEGEELREAWIRKDSCTRWVKNGKPGEKRTLVIEVEVNKKGNILNFRINDDNSRGVNIMEDRYLLDGYFRSKLEWNIPVPFKIGDILEDISDPGKPIVLAELPKDGDDSYYYYVVYGDGASLYYESSIFSLYYLRYYRHILQGQQRFLKYLSRHIKTGEFRLDELINLYCSTKELPNIDESLKPKKPRSKKALMSVSLPKYGQMLVTGKPVSPHQALEIIYRTDYVHKYGIFKYEDVAFDEFWELGAFYAWHARMNWFNAYTTSGGGWGWLRPDGQVHYDGNFSRYAEVYEIYDDWELVAEAFPFLEVNITLFNDEARTEANPVWRGPGEEKYGDFNGGEFGPLVSMRVRGGKIEVVDPLFEDVHEGDTLPPYPYSLPAELADPGDPGVMSIKGLVEWFGKRKQFDEK